MRKIWIFITVAAVSFFMCALPLFAFTVKSGEDVSITTSLNDDVYAFGSNILVIEDIEGDLIAAGGRIEVKGKVSQDLMVAGGMINLGGDVGDDVRTAGGIITISGNIGDDLMAAGGQITVKNDANVGGELMVSGGTISIGGEVIGDALLSGTNITISGKINGSVKIDDVEELTVTDGAEIAGDLEYRSAMKADISDKAKIGGEVKETIKVVEKEVEVVSKAPWAVFSATYFGSKMISFLSLFVLGIILLLAVPKFFEKFIDRMKRTLGYCVGAGAIMLFGVPIGALIIFLISIILFITLIGAGLGLLGIASNAIIIVLYALFIYTSTVFLSYFIGRMILIKTSLNMSKYGWKVLAYLVGLAVVVVAYSIPFAGWVIRFAGVLFGFGGIALVLKDMIFKPKESKA